MLQLEKIILTLMFCFNLFYYSRAKLNKNQGIIKCLSSFSGVAMKIQRKSKEFLHFI